MEGSKRRSYDVVVVGAGVIGLACAWRAAERGMSVLVIDREGIGAGASGVAAGMLAPVTEAEFEEQELLRLNLESRSLWAEFAAELAKAAGAEIGHEESGAAVVAADRDDAEELRRLHRFQRSLGLQAEWLSPRECRRLEPGLSPRIAGGILAPQDGYVDPTAVVAALASALERAGGELALGVEVDSLEGGGGRVTGVRTRTGVVGASSVVIAAGCWSSQLRGPVGQALPVRPVKGQILALRARPGAARPAERLVRTPRCYVVSRPDGRVVVGATVEDRGFDAAVTADGVFRLLEAAWEVLPDIGELELVAARAGLRPGTPDNAPVVGPGAAGGLVWATGHYRNGVLLAPVTALAVAELLTEGELPDSMTPFSPRRFQPSAPERQRVAEGV